jgi:hypothetical protein
VTFCAYLNELDNVFLVSNREHTSLTKDLTHTRVILSSVVDLWKSPNKEYFENTMGKDMSQSIVVFFVSINDINVISRLFTLRLFPKIIVSIIAIDPRRTCHDFLLAQIWHNVISEFYTVVHWERQNGNYNEVKITYHKIKPDHRVKKLGCLYEFSVMNEGLGGTISQIMTGIVLSHDLSPQYKFCLTNSLADPDPTHPNDYHWLLNYMNITFCKDYVNYCDIYVSWKHDYWSTKYVVSRYKTIVGNEYNNIVNRFHQSKFNDHLKFCVHIRTGDLENIPHVNWLGKSINIFGWFKDGEPPFCEDNECIFIKQNVEYDLINLINCENVIFSESTFSIIAQIFSNKLIDVKTRLNNKDFYR